MNKTFSYKNNSNYKSLDNLNKTKRIILNKKSDLINIPLQQLRTTQLKNFTGTLFDQIYEEAIALEHNQKIKKYYSERIEPHDTFLSKLSNGNKNNYENNGENKSNKMIKIINKRNQNKEQNDFDINKIKFEIKYDTSYGEEVGILGSNESLGNWNTNNIYFLKWNNGNIWNGTININKPYKNFEFKYVITYNREIKKWENGDNNKIYFDSICNELKHKKSGYLDKYEYNYDNINKELYLKCKWS